MKTKNLLLFTSISFFLLILYSRKPIKYISDTFSDMTSAANGLLPISATVGNIATQVLDDSLPKNAICIVPDAGGKSQCKKGLTCTGSPGQYGNCL